MSGGIIMERDSVLFPLMRIGGVIAVFAAFLAFYVWWTLPQALGGNFRLVNSEGQAVTQADLRAKPSAVFFGYTHCPDICPTTLADLQAWLSAIGNLSDRLNIWFVTVDPERDTPQVLHEYLANVSAKIIGVSGEPQAVRKMVESFNIAAQRVEGEDGEYSFNHTAAVLLLNKGGRLRGMIAYQEKDTIAVEKLKALAESAM